MSRGASGKDVAGDGVRIIDRVVNESPSSASKLFRTESRNGFVESPVILPLGLWAAAAEDARNGFLALPGCSEPSGEGMAGTGGATGGDGTNVSRGSSLAGGGTGGGTEMGEDSELVSGADCVAAEALFDFPSTKFSDLGLGSGAAVGVLAISSLCDVGALAGDGLALPWAIDRVAACRGAVAADLSAREQPTTTSKHTLANTKTFLIGELDQFAKCSGSTSSVRSGDNLRARCHS